MSNPGVNFGVKEWHLSTVTNTTGLFEWSPLTSIPDNFSGLSATTNIGRGFNCLHTRSGGLSAGVNSYDGLINVETVEYLHYEDYQLKQIPQTFAPGTFSALTSCNNMFAGVSLECPIIPLLEHLTTAAPNLSNKHISLRNSTDYDDATAKYPDFF